MAQNSLYPAKIIIKYVGAAGPHTQTIPIRAPIPVVGVPDEYSLVTKDGSEVQFDTAVPAYVDIIKTFMPTTVTFVEAELWTYATPTSEPFFRQVAEIGIAGVATSSPSYTMSQSVLSYRSSGGGVGKIQLMESTGIPNFRAAWRSGNPVTFSPLRTWLLSDASWVIARDGGYPLASLFVTTKTNDTVRHDQLFE